MRCCSIFGEVLREVLFFLKDAVMRLKPSGLRYLDIAKFQCGLRFYSLRCLYTGISVRFCGFVMLFCTVFGVYIPVFLCGFAVFVPPYAPLFLDFCLI